MWQRGEDDVHVVCFVPEFDEFCVVVGELFFEHGFEVLGDWFGDDFSAVFEDEYEVVREEVH